MAIEHIIEGVCVQTGPKVIVERAVEYRHGDEVLGWVTIEYDFSNLPSNLHTLALSRVNRRTVHHLSPGVMQIVDPEHYGPYEPPQVSIKRSFWSRLFRW